MSAIRTNGSSVKTHSNVLRKLLSSPYARLPKSCLECRRRKKSCEGGVPGCDNCQKRGTVHLCKYGDERDEMELRDISGNMNGERSPTMRESFSYEGSESSQTLPRHSSFHSSPSPLQDTSRLERLSNAAIEGGRMESNQVIDGVVQSTDEEDRTMQFTDPVEPNAIIRNRDCMPKWRNHLQSSQSSLPTKWQADQLINLHRQYLSFGGLMLLDDENLTKKVYFTLEQTNGSQTVEDEEELSMNVNDADASHIALVLVICASALSMLPVSLTFPITIGTSINTNDNERLADVWTQLAVEYFDQGDLYRRPKFESFEALVIYEYNLIKIGNRYSMIHRLDTAVRIGRILGLDRLGSADDDQRRWDNLDKGRQTSPVSSSQYTSDVQRHDQTTNRLVSNVPLNTFASGEWASRTFAARDHRRRECGRSFWTLLTMRDWNSGPQAGGTYNIHSSTFTTQWPKVSLVRTWKHSQNSCSHKELGNNITNDVEESEPWPYLASAAESFRQFIDLSGEAAVYNEDMRYEDMLKLDKSLMDLLDRRPEWIRPETGASRWRFGIHSSSGKDECKEEIEIRYKYVPSFQSHMDQCCSLMNLLSSTLWHKLFIIHRPFLSRSLSKPDVYGLTQHRTIYGALLLLECCNQYTEESNTTVLLFRLQHAAIALISMLLLQGAMFPNARRREAASRATLAAASERSGANLSTSSLSFDSLRIHKGLSFAIQALKTHGQKSTVRREGNNASNGVFHGLGDALEQLLNTAGRLEWRQRRANSRKSNMNVASQNGPETLTSPSDAALMQSRSTAPVGTNVAISTDPISGNRLQSIDMASPATNFSSNLSHTPSTNELMQNQSISQLDQDLFRLLGEQYPSQIGGGGNGENNGQFLNSHELPTRSNVASTQLPLNDGILPERPPWVQEDLWQSIFDTLNNWNV
jgi:Fungal Zn(2)-Cys(6) binuclear cluster domain